MAINYGKGKNTSNYNLPPTKESKLVEVAYESNLISVIL